MKKSYAVETRVWNFGVEFFRAPRTRHSLIFTFKTKVRICTTYLSISELKSFIFECFVCGKVTSLHSETLLLEPLRCKHIAGQNPQKLFTSFCKFIWSSECSLRWSHLLKRVHPDGKNWNVFPPSVSLSSQRTPGVWVVTAGCRPCCWHQWRKWWRGCPVDISAGCHVPPAAHPPTRRADPPGGSGQTSLGLPVDCRGLTAAPDCGSVGPEPGWSPLSGAARLRSCCIAGKLVLTCGAQIHPGRGWEIERLTFRWRPLRSTAEKKQTNPQPVEIRTETDRLFTWVMQRQMVCHFMGEIGPFLVNKTTNMHRCLKLILKTEQKIK